jgi:pimeloyl-ACP methyl ester carboxylesterase
MRRRVVYLLLLALLGYALLVTFLWWQQDRLVFPGALRGDRPIDVPGVEAFELEGLRGVPFRAVRKVPPAPRAVVAFFVGNGEDLRSAARQVVELAAHGVAVISGEYPGYGASRGMPTVESVLAVADAVAAHAAGLARELGVPFVVGGSSLGSFCALHVAAAGGATRCLLRSPPTSIAAVASRRFWWLPVGLLLRHRFDNETVAARVRCPVLVVHGDADQVVPLELGERLRSWCRGPAELVVVPGAGHNDLSLAVDGPVGARVGSFLRGS